MWFHAKSTASLTYHLSLCASFDASDVARAERQVFNFVGPVI